jgi:hypothetical protein
MSSRDRRRKIRISSSRFRNSGRNAARTASITCPRTLSTSSPSGRLARNSLPRLEVSTISALRKSTVRPCPSVSLPSSSTWSSTLKTSGWAFSTSSNRIT